jgi:radical SAM protein with 4Fe4S-binding SPASM domain
MIWRALEKIEFSKGECNSCEYEKVCGGCKARIGDWECPLRD